ncbi:VOC family protein [Marinilabilia salmonicolor]|uniref:VOC family protein n=1 Tax=Marinilabilia salmonicolor TaxID=989 RepID=UPI00029A90DB|nr:VOC family protein [Marinilabilia salmonicolor]
MIKHTGLSIRNIQEVYDFYERILGFKKHTQFSLFRELAEEIFGFSESPEVIVMKKEDIELELFISREEFRPAYTHTCLEIADAQEIFERAKKQNYKTYAKPSANGYTWFVADSNKNLFELKKPT